MTDPAVPPDAVSSDAVPSDAASPDPLDRRPDGVDDATVEAMGTLGEAVEWMERARGRLYDFHQMSGRVDLLLGEAADGLAEAGHDDLAERIRTELVGRNVIEGRWTFQMVEEYDDTYWSAVRAVHRQATDDLLDGNRHVFEAEMKARRITDGHPHHARGPAGDLTG